MDKQAKIYVAGHTGLVGSALMRLLEQKGYHNVVTRDFCTLDLSRQEQVDVFFEKEKPDYVFLAAAKVGGILANNTYKAEFIYQNMMIATNVIHASWKHGVKKLLNLGSSCIYPKHAPQPLKEEYLLSGFLEPTNEPYAIAKIAAIKLCRYYNEQYGTNFISLMPTNLYGPHDNFNLETAHVLPALMRKFHLAKLLANNDEASIINDLQTRSIGSLLRPLLRSPSYEGQAGGYEGQDGVGEYDRKTMHSLLQRIGVTAHAVKVWGSGEPYRELMHVDGLSSAALFLMEKYNYQDIGECINVGSGVDIKIKELVAIIKNIIGFNGDIIYDASKPDGTPRKLLDVSKINALGWHYNISTQEGVQHLYSWYSSRGIYESRDAVAVLSGPV